MKKRLTRRQFLETSLISSIAGRAAAVPAAARRGGKPKAGSSPMAPPLRAPSPSRAPQPGLESGQLAALRDAMDEIIPATDGMPAASQVGGVDYLDRLTRRDAAILKSISLSLATLQNVSRRQSGKGFSQLANPARVQALRTLERHSPARFVTLRDFTYEAYYTQPAVWKLIGYEFHPTDGLGPVLKPFDEAVLRQVRGKPRFYREVD